MIDMSWKKAKVLASAALLALSAGAPTAVWAQQAQCEDEGGPSKTLSTAVARVLQEVFEQMQAEEYQPALAALNDLIASRGGSMPAYDAATAYELRGSVQASLENFPAALSDFQRALNLGALPTSRNNQLRYFIAQLQFQEERYQEAINGLNQWIQFARTCGQNVDPNAYYLLAAAYMQRQPPSPQSALSPARNAVEANRASGEPRKAYYDLLNLVYSELNDRQNRAPLLEEMVNLWPGAKGYWTQLSGEYSQLGRDRDAFAVLEVAYRAGLLTSESELLTLIQYYSFFNNPYRGGEMLEREMAAGNIDRDQDNLVLLSQLWSQAREHKRSIPILREAAGRSSDGDLYYRLGQVLLADEQYAPAQRALENALNRGGMNRNNTGDAWLLLGTARFNQAGPEDVAIWNSA
ncbi:MAG: tetratricopeptide repeat protein, partial [Hyphococcus sp.]